MQTTTDYPPTTSEPDLIATAKRRGGLAAKIADELEATRRQLASANDAIDSLAERVGSEHLTESDINLASWLALAASWHPRLQEPTMPLQWPPEARRQLEELIEKARGVDLPEGQQRTRAEQLTIHAAIHELCEAQGAGPELADALVLGDDDRTWRRRYYRAVR